MKNYKKLFLPAVIALAAMFTFSCSKEKVAPAGFYFQAKKDNKAWTAEAYSFAAINDTIRLVGFNGDGEQHLSIGLKFTGPGNYTPIKQQAWFYTTIGMDVFTSEYKLDDTKSNSIKITQYDEASGIISGTFQLYFFRDDNYTSENTPLSFTEGTFRLKLPK